MTDRTATRDALLAAAASLLQDTLALHLAKIATREGNFHDPAAWTPTALVADWLETEGAESASEWAEFAEAESAE